MPIITITPEEASVVNHCNSKLNEYYVWCGIMALHGLKPLFTVNEIPIKRGFYEYEYYRV